MNEIGLPAGWLAAGHGVPGVCVRHGEPAVFRRLIRAGSVGVVARVPGWPFCARCRTRRWAFLAAGALIAVLPLLVLFPAAAAVTESDPALADRLVAIAAGATLASLLVGGLVGSRGAPTPLARARVSPDRVWVLFRAPHPRFAEQVEPFVAAARAQSRQVGPATGPATGPAAGPAATPV